MHIPRVAVARAFRAAAVVAATVSSASAPAAPSLDADATPRRVIVGDAFRVSVSARGMQSASGVSPEFEFPDAARLSNPSVQQSSSWINGRASASVSWEYAAVPSTTGLVHFGEVRLAQPGGRALRAAVPDVVVVPPPPQPWVRVSLSGPQEVFAQQPFELVLGVEVASPSGTQFAGAPILPARPPRLSVPWLFGEGVAPAVEPVFPPSRLVAILESGGAAGGGAAAVPVFTANGVCRVAAAPEPDPGGTFVRYAFSVPFRAASEGVAEFASARFAGEVAVGDGGQAALSPYVVALSEPLRVRVVQPPSAGRPASWGGVLATRATVSVSLDSQTCRQGDPIALSVEIEGDFDPAAVRVPDPFSDPAFSSLFRVRGEPSRTEGDGSVRFVWKVRPVASGTLEVPPVEFGWFDPGLRRYGVAKSDPLPLRVDPVRDFDPDALFAAAGAALAEETIGSAAPPALTLDPAGAVPPPRRGAVATFATFALPLLVWLLAVAFPRIRRAACGVASFLRRACARNRASSLLHRAETPGQAAAACAALLRARTGVRAGSGFGAEDLRAALLSRGASAELAEEGASLLRGMEEAAYRPGADVVAEVRSRSARLARIVSTVKVLVVVAGLVFAIPGAADDVGFAWRRACANAAGAATPERALEAARAFREIAERCGGGSGPCLRNLGATLLLAERPEEALDAFRRAEALEGETPESRAGVAAARSGALGQWWRAPLLPLLRMPLKTRRDVVAAAWALFWLALAARRAFAPRYTRARGALAALAGASALACAAFAASASASARILAQPFPPIEAGAQAMEDAK